jgi:hypothetical protein
MNPILPGAIHPDQAGEILKNTSLVAGTIPRRHKANLKKQRSEKPEMP